MDPKPLVFSLQLTPVTRLERLSIESFINAGYDYRLYGYLTPDQLGAIPHPATYHDAREILPVMEDTHPEAILNAFQYALMAKHVGTWADTDYVLLRPLPTTELLGVRVDAGLFPRLLRLPPEVVEFYRLDKFALKYIDLKDPRERVAAKMSLSWPRESQDSLLSSQDGCPLPAKQLGLLFDPGCVADLFPKSTYGICLWREAWGWLDRHPSSRFNTHSAYEMLWRLHFS
jgi:hypothetical protein